MATTGSPVSMRPLQPYWGAVGVSHGSMVLLTNGSSAHSEISWLSAWMSCSAQSVPPFGRAKNPGEVHEAHAHVWTPWLPFPFIGPLLVWDGTGPAPWKPITQQLSGFVPMKLTTLFVRKIGKGVGST